MSRRFARRAAIHTHGADRNTGAVLDAYRQGGATVVVLTGVGGGCPDLLVGYRGLDKLREVKPLAVRGEKGAAPSDVALRQTQEDFARIWRGAKVLVVRTPEQALLDLEHWEVMP